MRRNPAAGRRGLERRAWTGEGKRAEGACRHGLRTCLRSGGRRLGRGTRGAALPRHASRCAFARQADDGRDRARRDRKAQELTRLVDNAHRKIAPENLGKSAGGLEAVEAIVEDIAQLGIAALYCDGHAAAEIIGIVVAASDEAAAIFGSTARQPKHYLQDIAKERINDAGAQSLEPLLERAERADV